MPRTADPHAKSALVSAARREFVRSGIRGARIEDITHASGLSKGAFYLHYESKEALFGELVEAFLSQMEQIIVERQQTVRAWLRRNPIGARDLSLQTPRHREFVALEAKYDRAVLELIWDERDVFAVLSRGAQGTAFDGLMWQLADREVKRVVENLEAMKAAGACRPEVHSEVFASLVVGTWMLIAQQMSRLEEKPDLDRWVGSIQQLIHQGLAPRAAPRSPRPSKPSRRRTPRSTERRALS